MTISADDLQAVPRVETPRKNIPGNPPGTFLSDFALPDLDGRIVRASDLVGFSYLILFVTARCKPSAEVLRYVDSLHQHTDLYLPRMVVVCSGGRDAALTIADRHNLGTNVVVQEDQELFHFMRVPATPSAYLVDENRRTVGPLAIGADAVISLLPPIFTPIDDGSGAGSQPVRSSRVIPRAPTRVNAGAMAPDFIVSTAAGQSISLSSLQGRRVLVVFWSPDCSPCDEIAGLLDLTASHTGDLTILVVSRGDAADRRNYPQIQTSNVIFAAQTARLVSRAFGFYDAPSAIMIDSGGRIARPPAKGIHEVRALLEVTANYITGT